MTTNNRAFSIDWLNPKSNGYDLIKTLLTRRRCSLDSRIISVSSMDTGKPYHFEGIDLFEKALIPEGRTITNIGVKEYKDDLAEAHGSIDVVSENDSRYITIPLGITAAETQLGNQLKYHRASIRKTSPLTLDVVDNTPSTRSWTRRHLGMDFKELVYELDVMDGQYVLNNVRADYRYLEFCHGEESVDVDLTAHMPLMRIVQTVLFIEHRPISEVEAEKERRILAGWRPPVKDDSLPAEPDGMDFYDPPENKQVGWWKSF